LLAPIPTYAGPAELVFNLYAKKMREDLGADDPFVKQVLGTKSPAVWAHDLISGTKLGDVAVRKALFDGGQAAIDASQDPLIRFVASNDAQARQVRKQYEDRISAPEHELGEAIARARFAVLGTSVYPDAAFTQRLSYGTIKGFTDQIRIGHYDPDEFRHDQRHHRGKFRQPGHRQGRQRHRSDLRWEHLFARWRLWLRSRAKPLGRLDSRALLAGLRTVYHADRIAQELTGS
jgi:hypothetical protein